MATFAEVDGPDEEDDVQLCLFRMVGNKLKGKPYRLDPEGTEIGALSTSRSSINDVDPTVSGHHLRIWRGPGGHWYAEGLNSKNGTVLISGEDDSMRVVEPPRDSTPCRAHRSRGPARVGWCNRLHGDADRVARSGWAIGRIVPRWLRNRLI